MIVLSISDCPTALRGYLSKYLAEISTGVYVGKVSARVRDGLWKRVTENCPHGRAVMVFSANTEQGYDFCVWGSSWIPIDLDGFKTMLHPAAPDDNSGVDDNTTFRRRASADEYVVLDLETTGLDVMNSKIIEIGALLISGDKPDGEYQRFINIDEPLPDKIKSLTGIQEENLKNGLPFSEALRELSDFIAGRLVIGYNIKDFDEKILQHECRLHGIRSPLKKTQDVLFLARKHLPDLRTHKMQAVAAELGITAEKTHRALADCYLCYEIYKRLNTKP